MSELDLKFNKVIFRDIALTLTFSLDSYLVLSDLFVFNSNISARVLFSRITLKDILL